MRIIIIYCTCVLSSQMSHVLKTTTARYPILHAGCSITRIWHRASSKRCFFIGLRYLLAGLLLLLIPALTVNNFELRTVHAGQIPTVKKIYRENGKQEIVEISLNESQAKVVSEKTTPKIAAGYYHTVALKSDGTVWAWGDNTNGQLGDGTKTNRTVPVPVKEINSVVTITSKESSTTAQKMDSSFWIWGNEALISCEKPKQVNEIQGIAALGSFLDHPIALRSDGSIWMWVEVPLGVDNFFAVGKRIDKESPILMRIKGIDNVTTIVCGENYQVALKSDGTLWDLHSREIITDYGQKTISIVPNQICELNDVIVISGGRTHAIALKRDGTVWTWGNNTDSQLGDGTTTNRFSPAQVKGLNNITAVAGGGYHSVALKSDGTVWAWGDNNYGQLGIGTTIDTSTPVQVKTLNNINAIAAGTLHTIVLKSDGTIWTWGDNRYGQLGDGTNTNRNLPVQVVNINIGNVALSQSSIKP